MDDLAALVGLDACGALVVLVGVVALGDAPNLDVELGDLASIARGPAARPPMFRKGLWDLGRHMVDRRLLQQAEARRERERERVEHLHEQLCIAALTSTRAARQAGRMAKLPWEPWPRLCKEPCCAAWLAVALSAVTRGRRYGNRGLRRLWRRSRNAGRFNGFGTVAGWRNHGDWRSKEARRWLSS